MTAPRSTENGPIPLPCCNYIEAYYDHDPEGPCAGTMQPGWPEYVCDTCRARCGAQAHPQHAFPPEQHVHEWRYFASASGVSPVAEKCDGCGEFRVIPPGLRTESDAR